MRRCRADISGHENHRQTRPLELQKASDFHAAHLRHDDIEEHEVDRRSGRGYFERAFASGCRTDLIAKRLERGDSQQANIGIVVHNQYDGSIGSNLGISTFFDAMACSGRKGPWQIDRDGCPPAQFGGNADAAARLLGYAIDLTETEPGSASNPLCGEERFERFLQYFRAHAR